jgi:hypothetical protein
MQREVLRSASDDVFLCDSLACISCYSLEDECTCTERDRILWPLPYALSVLDHLIVRLAR